MSIGITTPTFKYLFNGIGIIAPISIFCSIIWLRGYCAGIQMDYHLLHLSMTDVINTAIEITPLVTFILIFIYAYSRLFARITNLSWIKRLILSRCGEAIKQRALFQRTLTIFGVVTLLASATYDLLFDGEPGIRLVNAILLFDFIIIWIIYDIKEENPIKKATQELMLIFVSATIVFYLLGYFAADDDLKRKTIVNIEDPLTLTQHNLIILHTFSNGIVTKDERGRLAILPWDQVHSIALNDNIHVIKLTDQIAHLSMIKTAVGNV